jgi:hypothetical protein
MFVAHDEETQRDNAAWEKGEVVLNSKGEPIKRKKPGPQMELAIMVCHCDEFGCTTDEGTVPEKECPIKCINKETGEWYVLDRDGNCTCPICCCTCNVAYSVSCYCAILLSISILSININYLILPFILPRSLPLRCTTSIM